MIAALDRAASAFACVQNVKATAVIVFSVIQLAVAAALTVSYALHMHIDLAIAVLGTPPTPLL